MEFITILCECVFLATVQPVAKKESQLLVAELKKVLGVEKCNQLVGAIKNYKDTENYETMVDTVVSLLTERNENFDLLKSMSFFCSSFE